jgi:hypothetical protein
MAKITQIPFETRPDVEHLVQNILSSPPIFLRRRENEEETYSSTHVASGLRDYFVTLLGIVVIEL